MTDILKPLLYYVLMLSAFALMIFTIGCSTENPLCSDNYCVEGEIYPRSELVGDFSPIAVDDSVILATFAGVTPATPIETSRLHPKQMKYPLLILFLMSLLMAVILIMWVKRLLLLRLLGSTL